MCTTGDIKRMEPGRCSVLLHQHVTGRRATRIKDGRASDAEERQYEPYGIGGEHGPAGANGKHDSAGGRREGIHWMDRRTAAGAVESQPHKMKGKRRVQDGAEIHECGRLARHLHVG